jgi:hypothetical protein
LDFCRRKLPFGSSLQTLSARDDIETDKHAAEFISADYSMKVLLVSLAAVAALSGNMLLACVSIMTLGVIWYNALRSPFQAIMASLLSFQWAQASSKIWIANYAGINLSEPQVTFVCEKCAFEVTPETSSAIFLAHAAIALIAIATRVAAPKFSFPFRPEVGDLLPGRLLVGYFCLLTVSRLVNPYSAGGLAQPLIVLGSLKFVFAILIAFVWISTGRGKATLAAVVLIEVALGFTGFFSGFKTIFLVLGSAFLTVALVYRAAIVKLALVFVPLLLILGSVWTVVKPAYRSMLNEGSQTQAVLLSMEDRVDALSSLSGQIGTDDLGSGLVALAVRLSYVDYLARVMGQVPDVRPHEGGALWAEAFAHVAAPRFLFPDKPALASDSERTMLYTGLKLGSESLGTSISIGYVGDSYIDFGFLGALLIPFVLGLLYAYIGRHLVRADGGRDVTCTVAVLVVGLSPARIFEVNNTKLLAATLWHWAVCLIFISLIWPRIRPLFSSSLASPITQSLPGAETEQPRTLS